MKTKKKKKTRKTKRRNYNKLNKAIMSIFVVLILFLVVVLLISLAGKFKGDKNNVDSYNVNNNVFEYSLLDASHIYLYNLDGLKIKDNKEYVDFRTYLDKYNNVDELFNDLESSLEVKNTLKDGGTIIYKTKDKDLFKEDLTIIKCHTEDGNRDIYFGKNMNTTTAFKNGACGKNFFEDKSFTRVYTLDNIKDLGTKEVDMVVDNTGKTEKVKKHYYELTIKDSEDNKVKIERVMDDESIKALIKGKKYTFYFTNKYGELIKDTLEDILDKCSLEKIVLYEE